MHASKYTAKEWKEFCQRVGCKKEEYQYVLSNLREWGLVLKKGGHHEGQFTVSTEFWDSLLKELHEFLGGE